MNPFYIFIPLISAIITFFLIGLNNPENLKSRDRKDIESLQKRVSNIEKVLESSNET